MVTGRCCGWSRPEALQTHQSLNEHLSAMSFSTPLSVSAGACVSSATCTPSAAQFVPGTSNGKTNEVVQPVLQAAAFRHAIGQHQSAFLRGGNAPLAVRCPRNALTADPRYGRMPVDASVTMLNRYFVGRHPHGDLSQYFTLVRNLVLHRRALNPSCPQKALCSEVLLRLKIIEAAQSRRLNHV